MCVCACAYVLSLVVRQESRIFSKEQSIVMCGLSDPIIFLHINYVMTGTIFDKKCIGHQMGAFIFLRGFILNVSHSKNRARYYHKCAEVRI
jgi:hypothetical protein